MDLPWLLVSLILAGGSVTWGYSPEVHQISEDFYNGYINYVETGVFTQKFEEVIQALSAHSKMKANIESRPIMCTLCDATVRAVLKFVQSGKTNEEIKKLVVDTCILLNIQTEEVCTGVIDPNLPIFLYIIDHSPSLTAERVCGTVFQNMHCMEEDPEFDWTVNITLGKKPPVDHTNGKPREDDEILTIVQLSDIHYDPKYEAGSNAVCKEPVCCRSDGGAPSDPEDAAGYWGDYRSCDTPWNALEDALKQVVNQHPKIDYVYMTGDLINHGVWETSRESNKDIINEVLTAIKDIFGDITVFPSLGNHEPHPLNVYAPPEITDDALSTKWLYETVATQWLRWLPEETTGTILQGGYYTTLARPDLRIIALNNNVCYTYNWWLLYDSRDPGGQLQWLADTLLQAEKAGEKVHILAHIPPGNEECYLIWSREFRKIIDRFEHIVTAHFNGHTHKDEFHLFYSLDEPTRANNIAFDGGSVTTFSDVNPNYRVYKVDAATGLVLDLETWIYNITDANLHSNEKPNWFKLYSFREAYGVESMTPPDLDKLVHRMTANHELLQQYHRYYVKYGDPSLAQSCDDSCLRESLCGIVTSQVGDRTQCDQILEEFNINNKLIANSA